jgi:sirohydrochlorin ferrochelatase
MTQHPQTDRTAILLIAHGSRHAPANDDLHRLAARFATRGDYPVVESCFLELAEPDIAAGGDRCVARGASRVLMVPYFLSAGVHLLRDLAAARDALRRRHPRVEFRLGPALGPHPLLDELVAERIRQTEAGEADAGFPGPAEMAARYAAPAGHGPEPAGRGGL